MKNRQRLLLFLEYLGYITIGFVVNMIGPSLLSMRNDFHLNYSQSGFVLSAQFIGMLISVLLGGYIADRYGKKPYILAGGFLLTAGLVGTMLTSGYYTLTLSVITIGIGYGAYSVGINALSADYAGDNPGKALSLLHLFFGIGAILSPPIVAMVQKTSHSWRPIFGIIGLLPLMVNAMLFSIPIQRQAVVPHRTGPKPYQSCFLWAMGLTTFIYVGIEVSVYGWLPSLWKSLFRSPSIPPVYTATIFWLALTLGRVVTGRLADRFGLSRFLAYITMGASLMTVLWWITSRSPWTIGTVFATGLFLAGVYPTIMATAAMRFPNRTGEVSSFISVFSALGGSLIPTFTGQMADLLGLQRLPLVIVGLSLTLVLGSLLAWRLNQTK